MAGWTPTLPPGASAPLYERLLDALRGRHRLGRLGAGARLPPQRDLAHRLGLGLGTVTRAYVEAEKAGLVQAHVGRGSFVRGVGVSPTPADPSGGPINLARTSRPNAPAADHLVEALAKLRKRPDLLEHLAYAPAAGLESSGGPARPGWRAAAGWRRRLDAAGLLRRRPAGLALALGAVARPGDTVLCEASTYTASRPSPSTPASAAGLAMDADGLRPDALEAARGTARGCCRPAAHPAEPDRPDHEPAASGRDRRRRPQARPVAGRGRHLRDLCPERTRRRSLCWRPSGPSTSRGCPSRWRRACGRLPGRPAGRASGPGAARRPRPDLRPAGLRRADRHPVDRGRDGRRHRRRRRDGGDRPPRAGPRDPGRRRSRRRPRLRARTSGCR
jgi:hypothetical protein